MNSQRRHVDRQITALCAVLLPLTGCAYGEMRQVLRAQVASELNCPGVVVERKQLPFLDDSESDKIQYKVAGCDTLRTYTCPSDAGLVSYDETQCEYVEGDSDAPEVTAEVAQGVEDPFAADSEAAPEEPPAEEPADEQPAEDSDEEEAGEEEGAD